MEVRKRDIGGCLFVLTNLGMLEFNISVLNFEDMHDMDVAEVDGGLISLKLRKQTDLPIRKFSFSRMTTGSAVGKGTGSFHLRIMRASWGKLMFLGKLSFNQRKKDSMSNLQG